MRCIVLLRFVRTVQDAIDTFNVVKRTVSLEGISDGYHTFGELYDYRLAYNALLFNEFAAQGLYDVHKAKRHSSGEECFGGGWFVVTANLPTGQVSNHYKLEHWNKFHIPERDLGAEWDGHTPDVALKRLMVFAANRDKYV